MHRAPPFTTAALIGSLLACSSPGVDDPPTEVQRSASRWISADAGGSIDLAGAATVSIPPGALDRDATVIIERLGKPVTQGDVVPVADAFELSPHGAQFGRPATVRFCYNAAALAAEGLLEHTVQIYYVDPSTGEYLNMGGQLDIGAHCVATTIDHFSTYLAAAQAIAAGAPTNQAPAVTAAANFLPSQPLVGIPLRTRTVITDFEQVGSPFGATAGVSSAYLYYQVGAAPQRIVALQPDYDDASNARYGFTIPAAELIAPGDVITYHFEATDNFGKTRVAATRTATLAAATSISYNPATLKIASGFRRDFTLRALSGGTNYPIVPDSFSVSGDIGEAVAAGPSVVRFSATSKGAGALVAQAGDFTASSTLTVEAGLVLALELRDGLGVALAESVDVPVGSIFDFDVIGHDAYDNVVLVKPVMATTGGVGTITSVGRLTAAGTFPRTGLVTATLGPLTASIQVNVIGLRIGGAVNGLNGTLVVRNNGGDELAITSNGPFAFLSSLGNAAPYNVTIASQPIGQTCTITGGSGVTAANHVTSVGIMCTDDAYTVGGTISGLTGTVVLRNNGGDDLTIGANGAFAFPTPVVFGAPYDVTVSSQPATQTCVVSSGTGTMGSTDVSDVVVTCVGYTVAVTVTGLSGGTLVLANNADQLSIDTNGAPFVFPATLPDGGSYDVTVFAQPAEQVCAVANGSGVIASDNVWNVNVTCADENHWTARASMPTPRYGLAVGVIDGKLYAAGGLSTVAFFATLEVYDPASGTWTTRTGMPAPRGEAAYGVIDGKLYVAGGRGLAGNLATLEVYDPATDAWATRTSMPTARRYPSAGVIDGKLYVVHGNVTGIGNVATLEVYDPATDSWTTRASAPIARQLAAAVVIDGKLHVVGGPGPGPLAVYDPTTDAWTTLAAPPAQHSGLGAAVFNGKLYAIGGLNSDRVERYDAVTDTWISKASLPAQISRLAAAVIDGRIYAVGGTSSSLSGESLYDYGP